MFMYLIVLTSMRNQRTGVDLMIIIDLKFHDVLFRMASSFLDDVKNYAYFF